jgi:hypothetical protein
MGLVVETGVALLLKALEESGEAVKSVVIAGQLGRRGLKKWKTKSSAKNVRHDP